MPSRGKGCQSRGEKSRLDNSVARRVSSAANAAIAHIRDWVLGAHHNNWVSMGVPSDGSYGIPEGVIYGFPVRCKQGEYHIVHDLSISPAGHERMQASYRELAEERELVKHLLGACLT